MVSLGSWTHSLRTENDHVSADTDPFWSRLVRQDRLVWVGAGTLAVCLVGLGVLVFMALGERHGRSSAASEVPLITADEKPFKVRPEDPGGLDVPDRDKLVYEQMRGAENVVVVERLLTEPEQPLQPPRPPQVTTQGNGQISGDDPGLDTSAIVEPPQRTDMAEVPVAPIALPPESHEQADPAKPALPAIPAPKARPQAPGVKTAQLPAAAQAGRYHVQLLAVRSSTAAMDEWNRLSTRYTNDLAGLSPHVSRLDRGSQSDLFRLRAGPLKDENAARALCQRLIKRNVGCVVVAPGA